MVCSKSSSKREVHNDTGIPQETRITSNEKPKLPAKIAKEKNKQNSKSADGRK